MPSDKFYPPSLLPSSHPLLPASPFIPTSQPTPSPELSIIGKKLGNFTLSKLIGKGGMGAVYLGVHAEIGKRAAIKIIKPELFEDDELLARFMREARLVSILKHPSIVDLYDYGFSPSLGRYLVMEYLEGETLDTRLRREGAVSPFEAVWIICQVLDALTTIHKEGILHRDIKPGNLFLVQGSEDRDQGPGISRQGPEKTKDKRTSSLIPDPRPPTPVVKIVDFGIAKQLNSHNKSDIFTTLTGIIIGTPAYLSPEQAEGKKEIDARSDLYSVGAVLFEMVTGQRPFRSNSPERLLMMHRAERPPRPSSLVIGLPAALERAILACLEKDPALRPRSASDLKNELSLLLPQLETQPLFSQDQSTPAGGIAGAYNFSALHPARVVLPKVDSAQALPVLSIQAAAQTPPSPKTPEPPFIEIRALRSLTLVQSPIKRVYFALVALFLLLLFSLVWQRGLFVN